MWYYTCGYQGKSFSKNKFNCFWGVRVKICLKNNLSKCSKFLRFDCRTFCTLRSKLLHIQEVTSINQLWLWLWFTGKISWVNYAKLVRFNFHNFCERFKVLHKQEITSTNQLMTKKPLIYHLDQPLNCVLRYP